MNEWITAEDAEKYLFRIDFERSGNGRLSIREREWKHFLRFANEGRSHFDEKDRTD